MEITSAHSAVLSSEPVIWPHFRRSKLAGIDNDVTMSPTHDACTIWGTLFSCTRLRNTVQALLSGTIIQEILE